MRESERERVEWRVKSGEGGESRVERQWREKTFSREVSQYSLYLIWAPIKYFISQTSTDGSVVSDGYVVGG